MTKETLVELGDVIREKEKRVLKIRHLTDTFRGTVVCFKLNIPGPIKDKPQYRALFNKAFTILKKNLNTIIFSEVKHQNTGSIGFLVVNMDPIVVKSITVDMEENNPAGRLYDIDVYRSGKSISRKEIGKGERKCLICGENVWICSRSRRHSVDSLLRNIEIIIRGYIKEEDYDQV